MKYDKSYFIAKFKAIPDEKWTTWILGTDDGPNCALGLCGCRSGPEIDNGGDEEIHTAESSTLSRLFGGKGRVPQINDGFDPRYKQRTPKARILAALYDLP